MLRWAIELGRIDIYLKTSMLSHYSASPRKGHLEMVYHIFAYLWNFGVSALYFDPTAPDIEEKYFPKVDWTDFYGDVAEEMPPHMPPPRGTPVSMHCFVDANHAGNVVTRRFHSGVLIFVQNEPIVGFQNARIPWSLALLDLSLLRRGSRVT